MTILKRITMVIAPFMVLFLFSFKTSANALPELTQATFEVIQGGMQDAVSVGSQYKGISPYTDGLIATYEILGELYMQYMNSNEDTVALWSCDSDDVLVMPLSEQDESFFQDLVVYDRLGNLVDPSDIYYVSYNNGYFHGGCYIDSNGDLLYDSPTMDMNNRVFGNVAFGGNLVDWNDWNNFYDLIRETALDNDMNVYIGDENVDFSDLSLFFWGGIAQRTSSRYYKDSYYVYIPNVIDFGTIQPYVNDGANPPEAYNYEFYINTDTANYVFEETIHEERGSSLRGVELYASTNHFHNYTYYRILDVDYGRFFNPNYFNTVIMSGYSYTDFVNFNVPSWGSPAYSFVFASHFPDIDYDRLTELYSADVKPKAFKPLQYPDGSVIHPEPIPDELIDIGELQETVYDPSAQPQTNPNFDPSEEISPTNYPELNPMPSTFPSASVLPNSGAVIDPNPLPTPSVIEGTVPMPSDGGGGFTNIPFFSNLQYRFPFSIPWDLKNAVGMLVTPPEAPAWDFVWEITVAGQTYSYHCVGDLSDFDELARLLRLLFLISALVSLAVITYKLYF